MQPPPLLWLIMPLWVGYKLIRQHQVCSWLLTITDSWSSGSEKGVPEPINPILRVPCLDRPGVKSIVLWNLKPCPPLPPNDSNSFTAVCFVQRGSRLLHRDILESAVVAMATPWWRMMDDWRTINQNVHQFGHNIIHCSSKNTNRLKTFQIHYLLGHIDHFLWPAPLNGRGLYGFLYHSQLSQDLPAAPLSTA